ncbi:MAG TPA: hypothetical protein VFM06_11555 [Candidatus Limnocylindria bacterium]|nr:hypothetical protein [Candidatus Limnocylindria bacterium]
MSLMDKVIAFFKSGGRAQKTWGSGTSKSWSAEKTWSLKKDDKGGDAPKT